MNDDAARPWVLLRGLTRDARHWGAFVPALQAAFPAAPLLTPDWPGNGGRFRERSPADVAAMTDDLRAQLQVSGLRPPYRVLALSLGAMVAVDWMHRQADELAAAVLINTSLRPYSPATQRLRPAAAIALLRIAGARNPRTAERRLIALTCRRDGVEREVLDDWTRWRNACPVRAGNALRQLRAAARFAAPPRAPPVPTLLLSGAGDALVDPACTRRLAGAWRCAHREHPWAGHDLPLDDAAWVVDAVREGI